MRKTLLILIMFMISISLFAVVQEGNVISNTSQNQATFSQIGEIANIAQFFEYLDNFISWRNWRFWVSWLVSIALWPIFMLLHFTIIKIFPDSISEKMEEREGIYFFIWPIFALLNAIFYTFSQSKVLEFYQNLNMLSVASYQNITEWVLWGGIVILLLASFYLLIREILVFKLAAIYTIPFQLLQGLILVPLTFLSATMLGYALIAIGKFIASVIWTIVGIVIFFIVITGKSPSGTSSRSSSSSSSNSEANETQRRINEASRREAEQREKFNREGLKKTRGW